MKTRNITETDLPQLATLFARAFNAPPWNEHWTADTAEHRLSDIFHTPRFRGIVGFAGENIRAFAAGHIECVENGQEFLLQEMYVDPEQQRTGLGGKILSMLVQDLRSEGVRNLYLLTDADGPAEAFYRKHGLARSRRVIVMGTIF
jgi:GNAT superfamily N-acetyltransferase